MRFLRFDLASVCLFIFLRPELMAQGNQEQTPFTAFTHFTVSVPAQGVRDKFDRVNGIPAGINSVGILYDPGYKTGKSPVRVGLETNWFRMGVQKHDPAGDLEETKSKSRYNSFNLVLRLEPRTFTGKWLPFIDVLGGAGIYTTTTRIDYGLISDIIGYLDSDQDTPQNDNIGKFWDASFQQGIAVGIHSRPALGKLGFQARVVYQHGQAVEISKSSEVIVSSSDQIAYNPTVVNPGQISIQLGVQIDFKR